MFTISFVWVQCTNLQFLNKTRPLVYHIQCLAELSNMFGIGLTRWMYDGWQQNEIVDDDINIERNGTVQASMQSCQWSSKYVILERSEFRPG